MYINGVSSLSKRLSKDFTVPTDHLLPSIEHHPFLLDLAYLLGLMMTSCDQLSLEVLCFYLERQPRLAQ